jgi:thiol-disulfide isomerase/thioredoxin
VRLNTVSLALALIVSSCVAQAAPAPAYESNPDFQKSRQEAKRGERSTSTLTFAISDWRKANKIAGGRCIECLTGIFNASMKLGDYKHAIEAAHEMDTVADDAAGHVLAEVHSGQAAIAANSGNKPNMAQLEEAHSGLVKATALTPVAYFYDGRVLSLMKRDPEAAIVFSAYAQKGRQTDPLILRSKHFALHPELAREKMVPAVIVNTLAGRHFNLDDMNGKVVLIDFWATWCGPCKQELPHIKKLAAQYADEPFELISVSWDANEKDWKDFVAANGMTWNQYRDVDHAVTNAFGINAIPHYFTIDANGVLSAENMGSESNIDGRIKKLVQQAKADREKMALSTPAPPAGGQ